MIEIDLSKLAKNERGTHEGYVMVHRQGKIFQRKQRLGRRGEEISKQKNLIEVVDWLDDHIRSQNGVYPPKNVVKTIKKYGWTYNGKVYRGIQGDFNLNRIKIEKPFSSWTKSKNVAISFALTGGYDDWLINDNNLNFPDIKERIKKKFKTKQIDNVTILEANISDGIDINRIRAEIDKIPEINSYAANKLPILYESEVLSLSSLEKINPKIKKIMYL